MTISHLGGDALEEHGNYVRQRQQELAARGLARYDATEDVIYLGDLGEAAGTIFPETGVKGSYEVHYHALLNSPATILRTIAHLSRKSWFSPQMLADFWDQIEKALRHHGHDINGRLPESL